MNGIKQFATAFAESDAEYAAVPNPYKSFNHPKMDLQGLIRYAQNMGKSVNELSREEIKPFLR